jgi:hypothetical protein
MGILNSRLQAYFSEYIPKAKELRNDTHGDSPLDIRDPSITSEGFKNCPPVSFPFRYQGKNLGCKISNPLSMNPAICPKQGFVTIPNLRYNYGEKGLDTWMDLNMKVCPWTNRIRCFFSVIAFLLEAPIQGSEG